MDAISVKLLKVKPDR